MKKRGSRFIKIIFIYLLTIHFPVYGQANLRIITFNIANFGKSKSDTRLDTMASWLHEADLLVLQEVVTGPNGAKAVALLAGQLSLTGTAWAYTVSEATQGPGTECYAFLWKKQRLSLLAPAALLGERADDFDREPFVAEFKLANSDYRFTVLNFHAVPQSKDPAREVYLLSPLHKLFADRRLMICGDFNLPHSHEAFVPLYSQGFVPALVNQRTTIKMVRDAAGRHLANAYDNIYYKKESFVLLSSGVIDFAEAYEDLKEARRFSDHLPVYADFLLSE